MTAARPYQHWRSEFAAMVEDGERLGVFAVRGRASALAELITAVGQGLGVQQYATARWDRRPALALLRELLRATVALAG
jgi:hypothetical protein